MIYTINKAVDSHLGNRMIVIRALHTSEKKLMINVLNFEETINDFSIKTTLSKTSVLNQC